MNPTPERALELAELLESEHAYCDTLGNRYFDLSGDFVDSLIPILRAYADLSKKWQAVLDAEPVELDRYNAGLLGGDRACTVGWWHDYIRCEIANAHDYCQRQADSLIIKPAP